MYRYKTLFVLTEEKSTRCIQVCKCNVVYWCVMSVIMPKIQGPISQRDIDIKILAKSGPGFTKGLRQKIVLTLGEKS